VTEPDVEVDATSTSSGLAAERARRQRQVDDLRSAGREPYPYRFERTHSAADVRLLGAELGPGEETDVAVAVGGRVMLKRDSGKLVFLTVADRGVDIQLFVSKAVVGEDAFGGVKALDRGDWIGARGTVMTTRTGEISVKAASVELLAKAIRPLPDKWHGLADPDIRYRQRYADLAVNAAARRVFEIRHAVVTSFRTTLTARGFVEVETPIFHVEPGGAHARPFVTHHNTLDMPLYLRVATELHLKRLIVAGLDRVFEIGRTFRNEGMDATHNPEFTMMESYQAFGDVSDAIELTEALIVSAARAAIGTTVIDVGGEAIDLAEPWPRVRMHDAVSDAVATKVHPSTPIEEMRTIAERHGVRWEPSWGSGKLIEELFEKLCEDRIGRPTFVTGHPVEVSPLARVDPADPLLSDRFELFIEGSEYANGYSELNDPVEQRQRFGEEQAARDAGDLERGSVDEDYLRALEYGMPPTAGLGVGIDRLVMLLAGVHNIKDVILFPTLRPEPPEAAR
jgi:lysyl-tRNA synthetase, class II